MTCDEIQEYYSAYIENDLPEGVREAVTRHIEQCMSCRREIKALKMSLRALMQVPAPALSDAYMGRLMEKAEAIDAQPVESLPDPLAGMEDPSRMTAPEPPRQPLEIRIKPVVETVEAAKPRGKGRGRAPARAQSAPAAPVASEPVAVDRHHIRPTREPGPQDAAGSTIVFRPLRLLLAGAALLLLGFGVGYGLQARWNLPATVLARMGLEKQGEMWLPAEAAKEAAGGAVYVDGAWRRRASAVEHLMEGDFVKVGDAWVPRDEARQRLAGRLPYADGWATPAEIARSELRRQGLVKVGARWVPREEVEALRAGKIRIDDEWTTPEALVAKRMTEAGYVRREGQWLPAADATHLAAGKVRVGDRWVTPEALVRERLVSAGYYQDGEVWVHAERAKAEEDEAQAATRAAEEAYFSKRMAGFVFVDGRWIPAEDEPKLRQGMIRAGGAWTTSDELVAARLRREGYIQDGDAWRPAKEVALREEGLIQDGDRWLRPEQLVSERMSQAGYVQRNGLWVHPGTESSRGGKPAPTLRGEGEPSGAKPPKGKRATWRLSKAAAVLQVWDTTQEDGATINLWIDDAKKLHNHRLRAAPGDAISLALSRGLHAVTVQAVGLGNAGASAPSRNVTLGIGIQGEQSITLELTSGQIASRWILVE